MGRCIKCKTETTQMCVGCNDRISFICQGCSLPCAWCGHEGPYCSKCSTCQIDKGADQNSHCGEPGNHACWGCDLFIDPLVLTAYECYECDDGRYCRDCVVQCSCGQDPTPHFLCINGYNEHHCQGDTPNGEPCRKYLCSNGDLFENSRMIFCDEHIPEFSDRIMKIITSRCIKI